MPEFSGNLWLRAAAIDSCWLIKKIFISIRERFFGILTNYNHITSCLVINLLLPRPRLIGKYQVLMFHVSSPRPGVEVLLLPSWILKASQLINLLIDYFSSAEDALPTAECERATRKPVCFLNYPSAGVEKIKNGWKLIAKWWKIEMEQNGRGGDGGWYVRVTGKSAKVSDDFLRTLVWNTWKHALPRVTSLNPPPPSRDRHSLCSFEACSLVVKGIINISFSCSAELLCVM